MRFDDLKIVFYIQSGGLGTADLFHTRRMNLSDPWGAPVALTALNQLTCALTEARFRSEQLGEKRAAAESAALRLQQADNELVTRSESRWSRARDG